MDQVEDDLHADDLAWARALAEGRPDALARYEAELVPLIAAQLRRRRYSVDQIEELQQALRARLFVGDGDGPAIASYAGRGHLRSWVLVAALREAVRQRRRGVREPAVDDDTLALLADRSAALDGLAAPTDAPDKQRYGEAFRSAFRAALAALSARDRNLLRMHLIDELTIDQIAALHRTHRATAARWLAAARDQVAREVRRDLMKQLGADPFEADELLQWIRSRVELSLSGLAR